MSTEYNYFMNIALKEAVKGLGFTFPNPMVGAVIVKDGNVLSTGYHSKLGSDHAERDAINKLSKNQLAGATLFVTLEPCNHHGRTPPCTDAIIEAGINKVVIAAVDPDKRVMGSGINKLKNNKIEVVTGVLEKEAVELNSIFFHYKKTGKPYIIMKTAMSLDGRIASSQSVSKWISCDKSREFVHKIRRTVSAIAVGHNTVIKDNPQLNCRIAGFESKPIKKIIFTNQNNDYFSKFNISNNPGEIFTVNSKLLNNKEEFYEFCIKNEICSILIEGGSGVYTEFIKSGLVDRLFVFYKTGFFGADALPAVRNLSIDNPSMIESFAINKIENVDGDIMLDLYKGEPLCLQGL